MDILNSSNYVEPVLIPGSDYEKRISASGEQYIHYCSDIDYLLGLKSVELLDPSVLAEMQRMYTAPSPKNISDEELIRFCKSRYIQEPADCQRWFELLQNYSEKLGEQYQKEIESVLEEENDSVSDSENSED